MKHTKGNWKVFPSGNRDFNLCIAVPSGGSICHVSNWGEAEANAKLIAAAPEMLKILKGFMKVINPQSVNFEKNLVGRMTTGGTGNPLDKPICDCLRVIKKAEGS